MQMKRTKTKTTGTIWRGRNRINESDNEIANKEQYVPAATDDAGSRGLKYSVQARIQAMHVDVNIPVKE